MKKLTLLALLVGTLTYAHPTEESDNREVYEFIRTQLDEGKIDVVTAQKMWRAYSRCCQDT